MVKNRLKESIDSMPMSERWTIVSLLLFCIFVIFAIPRSSTVILIPLTPFQDYILLQLSQTMMWGGGFFIVLAYRAGYQETLRSSRPATFTKADDEPYTMPPEELLRRSDQMDKVQSYLRTGISILLGIGAALLLWTLEVELTPAYFDQFLVVASGFLAFSAVVAVLFSFAHPTALHGGKGLGEGLVPTEPRKEKYCQELKEIIAAKEYILKRMRTAIGMGLFMFVILLGLSVGFQTFYEVSYQPAYPISLIFLLPLGSMAFFFFSLGSLVVGRPILGIIDDLPNDEDH